MSKRRGVKKRKSKSILIFLLILAGLLIVVFLFSIFRVRNVNTSFSDKLIGSDKTNSKDVKRWEDYMRDKGLDAAYEVFNDENSELRVGIQHANAHNFGKALYGVAKLEGISYCNSSFNFGCFHSYLGTAIHEQGLKIVTRLNQSCVDNLKSQSLGCQHGIGHGIMAYLGYEYEDLVESLEICESLPFNDPIGGCYGGAFMEYNFQTMLDTEGTTRQWENQKPFYPCDILSNDFRSPCYYWQSQWWATVIGGETKDKYAQMGEYCQGLKGDEMVQCFLGAGNIAGEFTNYNPLETVHLCKAMAFGNLETEILCRIGGAGSYLAVPRIKHLAPKLCDGLSSSNRLRCLQDSSIPI